MPVLIPQDGAPDGRINFSKQTPTAPLAFNWRGIEKSIEANPIKFDTNGEENLNIVSFNLLKHEKKKKTDIDFFLNTTGEGSI